MNGTIRKSSIITISTSIKQSDLCKLLKGSMQCFLSFCINNCIIISSINNLMLSLLINLLDSIRPCKRKKIDTSVPLTWQVTGTNHNLQFCCAMQPRS